MSIYYDRAGHPISREQGYALLAGERHVGKTQVGDYLVSTVHLVINHAFTDGPPVIFETMVFKGESMMDEYVERYSTEQEAREGHANIVGMVQALTDLA